jgi:stage V sporulation protein G
MEITEVRIKLMENSDDRLQAFCSITFDDSFVVRDLKIIEGTNGPFVAMPSRKLTSHCPNCGSKNHLKAGYCNQCGAKLREDRAMRDQEGRAKLYADIAHPINSSCREMIQNRVISEFRTEIERAKQPGYVSRYDDDYDDDVDDAIGQQTERPPSERQPAAREPSPPAVSPAAPPPMPPGSQLQPPESEPRAPHMPPAGESLRGRDAGKSQKRGGDFGAGVFEGE